MFGGDPTAYRAEPKISDASIGLMQILLATAQGEGYTGGAGNASGLTGLYDPATNTLYGTSYLATCLARTNGYVPSAISAYNGGFRPDLGFGGPAPQRVVVCLRRDDAGKCIESKTVQQGQYANAAYVNAVLGNVAYFESQAQAPPTVIGGPSPPLVDAHHSNNVHESQDGGRVSGHVAGPFGTHILPPPEITNVFGKLTHWISAASGKKIVTWLGLAVVTLSAMCAKLGADWIHANVPQLESVCTVAGYVGTVLTALGRGIADRRNPQPRSDLV